MDLAHVRSEVERYCAKYRRTDLPPLHVSDLYALFPDEENLPSNVAYQWPKPWPHGGMPGVYFIFGRGGCLLYIGKASMSNVIGGRLNRWFQMEKLSQTCKVVHPGWTEKPMYLATLPVADGMTFEASALEEYLIQRLNPPDNVCGRRRDEP